MFSNRILILTSSMAVTATLGGAVATANADQGDYAAMAYSPSTQHVLGFEAGSLDAARSGALKRCSEYADDCVLAAWVTNGCAAVGSTDSGQWAAAIDTFGMGAQMDVGSKLQNAHISDAECATKNAGPLYGWVAR